MSLSFILDCIDSSAIVIGIQILADDLWVGDGWDGGIFYFAVSDVITKMIFMNFELICSS